jgi:hypothetical protein
MFHMERINKMNDVGEHVRTLEVDHPILLHLQ